MIILVVVVMRGLTEFVKFRVVNNDIFLNNINMPSFPSTRGHSQQSRLCVVAEQAVAP